LVTIIDCRIDVQSAYRATEVQAVHCPLRGTTLLPLDGLLINWCIEDSLVKRRLRRRLR
jgi:hypothetical protein